MKLGLDGVILFSGLATLWLLSGTEFERPLLGPAASRSLKVLEDAAVTHPDDVAAARALLQAYLDGDRPGLSLGFLRALSPALGADFRIAHLKARALLDAGRNEEALAVEQHVIAACAEDDGAAGTTRCDDGLVASARRRVAILEGMLAEGVEDAAADPEASYAAYRNATREVRLRFR